jgi:hypothetical protein
MYESRYEYLVVRKPNMMARGNREISIDKMLPRRPDTGTFVLCSRDLLPNSNLGFEYGIITGDQIIGADPVPAAEGGGLGPHKDTGHDHLFSFLGTDPENPGELGGEVEFWLGEWDDIDKVVVNPPSSVYVPAGLAMFPMIWRNVNRPIIMCVLASTAIYKCEEMQIPVSMDGRPRTV